MRNDKRACIFEHEGFTYVANFELMTFWIITEEDETSPVTTLEFQKHNSSVWAYRTEGSDGPYQVDNDLALAEKFNFYYNQYLNRIIVGKDGRASHTAKEVQLLRVRASD